MFNIVHDFTFEATVTLNVTVQGESENPSFKAVFKALDDETIDGFDQNTIEGQKVFLRAATESLSDLVGKDDKPIPFSEELLEDLIGRAYVRGPMMVAYGLGLTKARLGN